MIRRVRLAVLILSPLWLLGLALLAGFRVNPTHSFPVGIYRTVPKAPEIGDLVIWRPPDTSVFRMALDRGYLFPGGFYRYMQMLKRLVAVEGDVITIDDAGVTVNGRRLKNSKPLAVDGSNRPLPVLRLHDYRISDGEVLLMSDYSPISFDGRYFGPIPRAQVQSVVRPVWTW